jgi:hypothetical protein
MMRVSKTLGSLIVAAVATVAITATSDSAQAGDEELVNVSCAGGNVTATAKKPWHVNDKAPWKWDKGEKVSVNENEAKLKGAKCEGTLKAFVCNGDQCKGPIAVTVK